MAGGRARVEVEDDSEGPTASLGRKGGRNRRRKGELVTGPSRERFGVGMDGSKRRKRVIEGREG